VGEVLMAHCPLCGKTCNPNEVRCKYCGHDFLPSAEILTPGTILQNRYEIQKLAHSGGMGYIYHATDCRLYDRHCVVKQVKESVESDPQKLLKLQEEALRMAKLNHPNVAMILDHFVERNYYFLVVEYIQGKSLREISLKRKLTEDEVRTWSICMCNVLDYIHKKGIVHRDISPDNIMLTQDGNIKFIDFGTLRELRYIASHGTMGVGKFGFTPNEQWHSKPIPESDIFALGATIFNLLTGYLPVSQEYMSGKGPQPWDFSPKFPPIREKSPLVTAELELVLQKALQPEIEQRYHSATEFKRAIENTTNKNFAKQPDISISDRLLDFSNISPGSSTSKSFSLKYMGSGSLTGTITATQPWIKIFPAEIDLDSDSQDITVTVDANDIGYPFDGNGQLEIATSKGTTTVQINVSTTNQDLTLKESSSVILAGIGAN
jgi:serine/threonine protein kinase